MKKIFTIKEKNPQNPKPNWNKQNRLSRILIYIRQFYTTLLPQRGLEILVKLIYAHFKANLCCQNSGNSVTELLRVIVVNISQKILSMHVFITRV